MILALCQLLLNSGAQGVHPIHDLSVVRLEFQTSLHRSAGEMATERYEEEEEGNSHILLSWAGGDGTALRD